MVNKSSDNGKINLMLLKETLWKVEDKINVILESIADHEAEQIRQKRLTNLILERLSKLEAQSGKNIKRGVKK